MFRLWAKEWKSGHLIKDTVIEDDSKDTRTHKVLHSLTKVCREFDLAEPIWLNAVVKDFQKHSKCRFTADAFVEEIDFDYLEIQIIEEDDFY